MNDYEKQLAELKAKRCEDCGGSGRCDDAEIGDISFRTWTCTSCNGTGLRHEKRK